MPRHQLVALDILCGSLGLKDLGLTTHSRTRYTAKDAMKLSGGKRFPYEKPLGKMKDGFGKLKWAQVGAGR